MANDGMKPEPQRPKSEDGETPTAGGGGVEDVAGNARDREMGREAQPLGDLGQGHRTWTPPAGEQGMSNRPDDGGKPAHPKSDESSHGGDQADGRGGQDGDKGRGGQSS
jgi:hypothetical protein